MRKSNSRAEQRVDIIVDFGATRQLRFYGQRGARAVCVELPHGPHGSNEHRAKGCGMARVSENAAPETLVVAAPKARGRALANVFFFFLNESVFACLRSGLVDLGRSLVSAGRSDRNCA